MPGQRASCGSEREVEKSSLALGRQANLHAVHERQAAGNQPVCIFIFIFMGAEEEEAPGRDGGEPKLPIRWQALRAVRECINRR